jgi:sugar phosphate isomerase/epimerase
VKQLGFDTLEINTLRLTKMSDAEIGHFMGRAKELQVGVLGVIDVPANLDPAAPDASIRKAGIDYEMNLIRTCAKAGIPCASGVLYRLLADRVRKRNGRLSFVQRIKRPERDSETD